MARARRFAVVCSVCVVMAVLWSPAAQANEHRTTPRVTAGLVSFVCDQLEGPAEQGAKNLISRLTKQRMDGGLMVTFVVNLAFTQCETAVNKVTDVARRLTGLQPPPARARRPSSLDTYRRFLDDLSARLIATRLRPYSAERIVTSNDVFALRNALCRDARQSQSPATTLAYYVPNANQGAMAALNSAVDLVLHNCSLTPARASFLSLGVTSYVLGAIVAGSDFDPPFVLMFNPDFNGRNTAGNWNTHVSWIGFDASSGVASYELWLRSNQTWRRLAYVSSRGYNLAIKPSFSIQFAVRARDRAGNYSAWSYSNSYDT
jgi:hypothetical protein